MLDITAFLGSGKIGDFEVGILFEDFESRSEFGVINEEEKHYYSESSMENFSIFQDEVEYMFVGNSLNCISISATGNHLTILEQFNITVYTTLEKLLVYLDISSLNWEFESKYTFSKQLSLKLESGVQISYSYEKENGFILSKIQKYF